MHRWGFYVENLFKRDPTWIIYICVQLKVPRKRFVQRGRKSSRNIVAFEVNFFGRTLPIYRERIRDENWKKFYFQSTIVALARSLLLRLVSTLDEVYIIQCLFRGARSSPWRSENNSQLTSDSRQHGLTMFFALRSRIIVSDAASTYFVSAKYQKISSFSLGERSKVDPEMGKILLK